MIQNGTTRKSRQSYWRKFEECESTIRNLIIDELIKEMRVNKSIFFITADMGINLVEPIEQEFPDRFLNVGIAEQNAIGVAAGLANLGFKPWVYSISNFLIHRCFEQIRNDVVLHDYPVTLLGTSAGFDNSTLGPTHHIIDDWGLIAQLPNTQVFCPSSDQFCQGFVRTVASRDHGLVYARVAKGSFSWGSTHENMFCSSEPEEIRKLYVSYGGSGNRFLQGIAKSQQWDSTTEVLALLNQVHPVPQKLLDFLAKTREEVIVFEDCRARVGLGYELAANLAELHSRPCLMLADAGSYDFCSGSTPEFFERQKWVHLG